MGAPCEFSAPPSQGCCEEENVLIDYGSGFVFTMAECGSARAGEMQVMDLEFSYPNQACFISRTHYHN